LVLGFFLGVYHFNFFCPGFPHPRPEENKKWTRRSRCAICDTKSSEGRSDRRAECRAGQDCDRGGDPDAWGPLRASATDAPASLRVEVVVALQHVALLSLPEGRVCVPRGHVGPLSFSTSFSHDFLLVAVRGWCRNRCGSCAFHFKGYAYEINSASARAAPPLVPSIIFVM